ncbi:nucleoporin domain-containing protein [Hirsutella rhossiliensis]|uniref:Nucleoporin domain-containing protein n=1 Tax=Hirsutella rhossiliensis TaxID=111463 RepID=A0A9P8MLX6_9HYPO|nr:nucleoporin domain-containing protein [Hirsutella rhossiliensis]KAH0957480.1 nucleoporin domain-containing protein [Hirsutella rhossiliensis]
MDASETQYLFKETRLNLDPPSPASGVGIRVPSKAASFRGQQRLLANDSPAEDETAFRLNNLATASSVYHRRWHDTPRSFLWRVLEDGRVLSIRAVDICKKDKAPDAPLVLNFSFAVPIQPGCVAFADPEEHDALCVFVLDQASQLYTFTLRPDLFRKRTAVDASLSELGKVQSPAGLGFKSPHRLVAVNVNLILATVNDGGIIRFDRTKTNDSSGVIWKESFFNVQGWTQNLRSLLPFQGKHTIKYGKVSMEYSAATSIQVSSFGLEDGLFAITVCLDHRMRIWNVEDGQILHTGDILDVERPPQEVGKWSIHPSQSNLVQLVGRNRGQRICATYSPVGQGEFKFWKIIVKDSHTVIVEDVFPKNTLLPPAPSSSDIWTMTDFVLSSPAEGSINIWTLWKNNMTYRVQRLELDRKNMELTWEDSWEGVFSDAGIATVHASGPCDPTDVTEKWLQAILQPGRFTKATLETALAIYERGLGTSRDSSRGRGLAESICSVLGSTASLERGPSGAMDYEQFRASNETQWRRFYRLLNELDRQRGEALGLALDPEADMVWVVCTDLLSAITECSSLERLCHNLVSPDEDQVTLAALVGSAFSFVDGFSDNYIQLCNAALRREIFEDSPKTDLERIQYFSDKAGFWRGITDEDCAQIVEALGANFGAVTDRLYRTLLDLVAAPLEAKRRQLRHPLTEFGKRLIMKGVQDCIELQWRFCFSQLILLVHMEFEFDNEEEALHHRVDVGLVFRELVHALRRLELLKWLARTELSVPLFRSEKGTPSMGSKKGGEETQIVTALEANVGHLLGVGSARNEPLSLTLTELVANLCAPDSDIEVSPTLIQCSLVRRERADLALDLAPFCDQNPFSVYIQGRVLLVLKDFEAASTNFRKAAIGMGTESVQSDRHSCGLLDDTEWNLLNSGQARYYSHIAALYEEHRAYSYVLCFARLAVQFLGLAKGDVDDIKTDMLSRLFHAALTTSQFELAHTSLLSIKDDALRQSSLRMLVDKMCDTYHSMELVALPFPGMQQEVDTILAQRCKRTMDVMNGFPYHQVLYSWRIKRSNYRGAASILLDRIQKLRHAGEADKITGEDVLDTPVTRQYLMLINALSCVDPKQAWVFDEGIPGVHDKGNEASKRKVVSLADVRKQYQDELDRIAAIQNNQFGFEADDVMDIV